LASLFIGPNQYLLSGIEVSTKTPFNAIEKKKLLIFASSFLCVQQIEDAHKKLAWRSVVLFATHLSISQRDGKKHVCTCLFSDCFARRQRERA